MKKLLGLNKWPTLSLSVRQIRVLVLLFTAVVCVAGLMAAGVVMHYRVQAAVDVYNAEFTLHARAAAARLNRHIALLQRTRVALESTSPADTRMPEAIPAQAHRFWPHSPLPGSVQQLDLPGPVGAPTPGPDPVGALARTLGFAWRQMGSTDTEDGNVWLSGITGSRMFVIPQFGAISRIRLADPVWRDRLGRHMQSTLRNPQLLEQLAMQPDQPLLLAPDQDAFNRAPILRLATLLQPDTMPPVVLALDLPLSGIAPRPALFGTDFDLVQETGHGIALTSARATPLAPLLGRLQQTGNPLSGEAGWQLVRGDGLNLDVLFVRPLGEPGWYAVARISAVRVWQDVEAGALWLGLSCLVLLAGLAFWVGMIDRRILRPTEQQSLRIQESEALNQGVFKTAPVGLMVVTVEQGDILQMNDLAREFWTAAAPSERALLISYCQQLAAQGGHLIGTGQFDTTLAGDTGERTLQVRVIEMQVQRGAALLISLHDNTETHASEARMKQALAETAKANRAKSEFLATMSHEIRTPLNGMLGGVELLAMTALDVEQRDRLEVIRRSSASLITTLNDVLDFSKIEAGEMVVRPHACKVLDLLENAARNFAPLATRKSIALHCLIDPAMPTDICIDGGRVEQVVSNLLSNAIKFTTRGRVTLVASVMPGQDCLDIKVLDTGMGISEADQAFLFEPFVQGEQSDTRRFEGTGLGLSICKRLVALMQGDIHVTSEPGVGACFGVRLPFKPLAESHALVPTLVGVTVQLVLSTEPMQQEIGRWLRVCGASVLEGAAPHGAAILVIDEPAFAIYAQTSPPQTCVILQQDGPVQRGTQTLPVMRFSAFARQGLIDLLSQLAHPQIVPDALPEPADYTLPFCLRVLLVEDHEVNQIVMRKQLEHLGQRVDVVGDGEAALQQLGRQYYQLVITDIQMPRMDGYELARRLRAAGYAMPLVAISARVFQDEIQRCAAVGIEHYLSKPLRTEQLAQLLQQVAGTLPVLVQKQPAEADYLVASDEVGGMPDTVMCMALQADIHTLAAAFNEQDLTLWQGRLHALSGALAVLDYPVESKHCRYMEQRATAACLAPLEDWQELQHMVADITATEISTG